MSDDKSDNNQSNNQQAATLDQLKEELTDQLAANLSSLSDVSEQMGFDLFEDLESMMIRGVSVSDVMYLLSRYPFVQLVDGGDNATVFEHVKIVKTPKGFDICHYGDSMASSAGRLMFGRGHASRGQDQGDDGEGGSGLDVGTIVRQRYITAQHMIELALEQEWASVHVVDGYHDMARDVWIEGQRQGMMVTGFLPSEQDERVRDRILMSKDELSAKMAAPPKKGL